MSVVLFFPSLFLRDLWKPDEPRYAQVSREMVETGEWLVPHLNGKTYAHKPPLVFWFGAAARTLGLGANGGRLASMLAALGTVLLTAALGRHWFSPVSALLAGLILATTFEFGWMARNGGLDSPLTFLTTLAIYAYVVGGRVLPLLYIAAGLSVLVKGPVGLLFVVLGAASIRWARVPTGTRGWKHMLWGVPLALAIIAAWVVPACIRGGEAYTQELLFKQIAGRAVHSWSHARPFYYYVMHLPEMFALWIVMAVPAARHVWRRRKREPALFAMMLWFVLALVVFSLISGKRTRYLLPIFPAFALILARGIEVGYLAVLDPAKAYWMRRAARVQCNLVVAAAVACGVLFAFGGFALDHFAKSNPMVVAQLRWVWEGPWHWVGMVGMGTVATIAFRCGRAARTDDAQRVMILMALISILGWLAGDILLLPVMNTVKSPVAVTRKIDELFPPGGTREVHAYRDSHHGAYSIYSKRLTWTIERSPKDAIAFVQAAPGRALLVARRDLLRRGKKGAAPSLYDSLPPEWSISEVGRVGSTSMLLVSPFEVDSLRRINTMLRR